MSAEPALIPSELLHYATREELAAYEQHLRLELALRSPLDYALYTTPMAVAYEHIILLNDYIMALFEGRLYRSGPGPAPVGFGDAARHPITGEKPVDQLAISMPPRHGKSFLVSEHLPAWFLTKYPDFSFILTSYEAEFAAQWGRKSRNLIEAHPEFGTKVSSDSRAADKWDIAGHRGGMQTAGAGGAITGKGGHGIVIDDPVKNSEEAQSETDRKNKKDWLISTVESRREPYPITGRLAPLLLMATRWHEDDLIGWATAANPADWCVLNLPAIAFEPEEADGPDPLNRQPGEALCPARYTAEQLIQKREQGDEEGQGEAWFNALYQGRPTTRGSGIFKKPSFRYYTALRMPGLERIYNLIQPDGSFKRVSSLDCFRFQTIDLAASLRTSADYTVIATWDVTKEHDLILVDRKRLRLESSDHLDKAQEEYDIHKPRFVGVEKQTYGLALIQSLLRGGYPVRKLETDTDKVTRALPAGDLCDNGKVYFPKDAEWRKEWEDELLQFPNGRHDDQVDCLAYAARVMAGLPHQRQKKRPDGTTLEDKVARFQSKIDKKRKQRTQHPSLGRI